MEARQVKLSVTRGSARARVLAASAVAALASWPALAVACPQCASRAEGGISQYLALGVFVTFPFAVVAVVMRFIKRGDGTKALDGAAPVSAGVVGNDLGTTPSRRPFS
jgi:hypothetical protein